LECHGIHTFFLARGIIVLCIRASFMASPLPGGNIDQRKSEVTEQVAGNDLNWGHMLVCSAFYDGDKHKRLGSGSTKTTAIDCPLAFSQVKEEHGSES